MNKTINCIDGVTDLDAPVLLESGIEHFEEPQKNKESWFQSNKKLIIIVVIVIVLIVIGAFVYNYYTTPETYTDPAPQVKSSKKEEDMYNEMFAKDKSDKPKAIASKSDVKAKSFDSIYNDTKVEILDRSFAIQKPAAKNVDRTNKLDKTSVDVSPDRYDAKPSASKIEVIEEKQTDTIIDILDSGLPEDEPTGAPDFTETIID